MSDVVPIGCITYLDLDPDIILDAAKDKLETAIIIGYTKDGDEYFASTKADGADILFLLERTKLKLLNIVDELSD